MCGGFAHSSGHLGSRQAVLRRGDAVCQGLARHLLLFFLPLSGEINPPTPERLPPRSYPPSLGLGNPTCPRRHRRSSSLGKEYYDRLCSIKIDQNLILNRFPAFFADFLPSPVTSELPL